jgi:hypothetical protein
MPGGTLLARADEVIERSRQLFEPGLIDNSAEVSIGSMLSKNLRKGTMESEFETNESRQWTWNQGCALAPDFESMLRGGPAKSFFDSIGKEAERAQGDHFGLRCIPINCVRQLMGWPGWLTLTGEPSLTLAEGEFTMDNTTLLIIIIILLLVVGGGWYGRGRWF